MIYTDTSNIDWIVKPTYDEIIAYDDNHFIGKKNDKYYVLDFEENVKFKFQDQGIYEVVKIENEHDELRSVVKIRFQNDKTQLFNYQTLMYLHKEQFYLLQTEGYYDTESRLIRIFDNLKEGIMSYSGEVIVYPRYEGVVLLDDFLICFSRDKIEVKNKVANTEQVLNHSGAKAYVIKPKRLIYTSKQNSPYNLQVSKTVVRNGVHYTQYTEGEEPGQLYGLIDFDGNEIIPFEYTTLNNKQNLCLIASKNGKLDQRGNVANNKEIRYGLIDFENRIILPFEYNSFGVIYESYLTVENQEGKRAIFDLNEKAFQSDFIYNTWDEADNDLRKLLTKTKTLKIRNDNKVGLTDRNGKVLIPPIYRMISETEHENIYNVYSDESEDNFGGQGFYNINLNKEIVPARYADRGGYVPKIRGNENGYIVVMDWETSDIGFYKPDGQLTKGCIYDENFEGFSNNLGAISLSETGKYGIIDLNGNLLIDYKFDYLTRPLNFKSIATVNGKQGIINLKNVMRHKNIKHATHNE